MRTDLPTIRHWCITKIDPLFKRGRGARIEKPNEQSKTINRHTCLSYLKLRDRYEFLRKAIRAASSLKAEPLHVLPRKISIEDYFGNRKS